MENIDTVLSERGERYGAFETHADITQQLKHAMRNGDTSLLTAMLGDTLQPEQT